MSPRVLVTGAAGFVGANLVRRLLDEGMEVRGLDDGSSASWSYLEPVADDIELVRASILDENALTTAVSGVEAVVHLAARSGVPPSIAAPDADFTANVEGTFRVADAARRTGARRMVFASSGAVLAGSDPPLSEDMTPTPRSPYGASKLYGEALLQAFEGAYGIVGVSLRFSNVYGPFSLHKSSVVSVFLRSVLAGRPLAVEGDGAQTRDFIHVDDICAGIVRALRVPAGGVLHLGTGRETGVRELAALVAGAAGVGLEIERRPSRAGDPPRNFPETGAAERMLGWRAAVGLRDGLARTLEWYRSEAGGFTA